MNYFCDRIKLTKNFQEIILGILFFGSSYLFKKELDLKFSDEENYLKNMILLHYIYILIVVTILGVSISLLLDSIFEYFFGTHYQSEPYVIILPPTYGA